jgi:hypothetical protein
VSCKRCCRLESGASDLTLTAKKLTSSFLRIVRAVLTIAITFSLPFFLKSDPGTWAASAGQAPQHTDTSANVHATNKQMEGAQTMRVSVAGKCTIVQHPHDSDDQRKYRRLKLIAVHCRLVFRIKHPKDSAEFLRDNVRVMVHTSDKILLFLQGEVGLAVGNGRPRYTT